MIGTIIIAAVGYGLSLAFAYSSAFHGWKAMRRTYVRSRDIPPAVECFASAVAACIVATITRWLTGGQF